ncbi:MAG: CGNR zinc finger domain-containing protein [Natronosporangium sp.]
MRIAVDLVNTHRDGVDRLAGPDDLRRFLLDHAEPEPVSVTDGELTQVRVLRQRLRAVFEAEQDADAAAILNALFADHATRPYLSDHDGTLWHLHVSTMDADWGSSLAALTAIGLAVLVAGHGFDALRRCAAADCEMVFVVTTPGRVRRFCSPACATRTRVSSYRARHRGGRTSGPAPAAR